MEIDNDIQQVLSDNWPVDLAKWLDVSRGRLETKAFRRKVFDNVLMNIGRN